MKTITKTFNIYTFTELSAEAKAKALNDYQENSIYPWSDENEKTLNKFVEHFDFIGWTKWSYGNGVYNYYGECGIDTPYHYEDLWLEELTGVRLYTFIQTYMDGLKEYKKYYKGNRYVDVNKPQKTHTSKIKWSYSDCNLTGYYIDCEILEPILDYLENFPKYKDVTLGELMDRCLANWARACDSDYEHYHSEEYLEENANEMGHYFYEDGRFYCEATESEVA